MATSPALSAGGGKPGSGYSAVLANPLGAHHRRQDLDHDTYIPDVAYALADRASMDRPESSAITLMPSTAGVRRLTPLECERLMGWPDDHTRWAVKDGRVVEVPDSHRYKLCGNGVVANVAEWIGRRLIGANKC